MLLFRSRAITYSKFRIVFLFLHFLQVLEDQEISEVFPAAGSGTWRRMSTRSSSRVRRSDAGAPSYRNIAVRASKQKPKFKFRSRQIQKTWFRIDSSIFAIVMDRDASTVKMSMPRRGLGQVNTADRVWLHDHGCSNTGECPKPHQTS